MPDSPPPASYGAMLNISPDVSPTQPSHPRRARPPDPHADLGEAFRVPLRAELGDKTRRRDSRLGLRSIFGRNRGGSDADRGPGSPRDVSQRPGGLRASLAEINWPYGVHHTQGHRSEVSLPASKPPPAGQSLKHKKSESTVRQQFHPDGISAWNPPPLFQAYPQAIKHAHLPACTVPAEVILRLHNHRSSGSLANILRPGTPDSPDESTGEKSKRRHRRNVSGSASKFEWTSKVFILVTSGYLLQYAGEGTYDRLPERVLQLGKDSAAFASDAIPGRHWVLQVSSVADPDRAPSSHTSLRARLPFRGQERRHASTFLMVFESAEQMEGWIAVLRREIETLGGRKVLSETGKPKASDQDPQLKGQTSQRTLVVRDPDRFSRVMTPDESWNPFPPMSSPDIHLDSAQDYFDDNSTASFISHDGRQLDALRDSTNRFSFNSWGQRTMITSVGSSPTCSPIRDSFGELDSPEPSEFEEQPQPRLRPNAMAIIDRRQSLQTINHVIEMGVVSDPSLRRLSTNSSAGQDDAPIPPTPASQPMQSSSAIHNTAKQYSAARAHAGKPPQVMTSSPLGRTTSSRRPPPSALSINPRPLSLVEDQPSPALSSVSRGGTGTERTGSPLSAIPSPGSVPPATGRRFESGITKREVQDNPTGNNGAPAQENASRMALYTDRRSSIQSPDKGWERHHGVSPSKVLPADTYDMPRSTSALGTYGGDRLGMKATVKPGTRLRRMSFASAQQDEGPVTSLAPPPFIRPDLGQRPRTPSLRPVPRSSQHLRADSQSQSLLQRRSMSQLADGPPPAPPPNRALPPIPQKAKMNAVPPPGFI
ncbi:uncharacterized protein B0T15DRAFT_159161 [Chaetomium strumarium]|uniref:PH domain-containing protein n=1 Tax=Chaetomium strumarium TaxID=1170767 RepID=A0AAJ0GVR3_9PEZI|nr:hypothetical protein B0T15DRAFT_159161 [Chaetomium strumarium]